MIEGRTGAAWFTVTGFISAFLLFSVQPLVTRVALPDWGGAATTWSTVSMFFQLALLAGYAWVHLSRKRPWLLALPIVAAVWLAFQGTVTRVGAPGGGEPVSELVGALAVGVGPAAVALACASPALTFWYARTRLPRSHDPYFLYAASNAGSLTGLAVYPFLVEPWIGLDTQAAWWAGGLVLWVVFAAGCAFLVARSRATAPAAGLVGAPAAGSGSVAGVEGAEGAATATAEPAPAPAVDSEPAGEGGPARDATRPVWSRIVIWGLLAMLPATLSLAVTSHLSAEVAPVPLLWVAPLAVYLLTWIVAFTRPAGRAWRWVAGPASVVLLGVALVPTGLPVVVVGALNLVVLFIVGYTAHSMLAHDRPAPQWATLFYVVTATGGLAGAVVNSVIGPLVLTGYQEYPLALLASMLLMPRKAAHDVAGRIRRWLFVAALVVIAPMLIWSPVNGQVWADRSFYGALAVYENGNVRTLSHGKTIHGKEFTDQPAGVPSTYYARSGPLGDVFPTTGRIGVVGLGAGTMAAYAEPGQEWVFWEVDPLVTDAAREWFRFLSSTKGTVTVDHVDGRAGVEASSPGSFDVLVLDAFSSDAVPTHLLTTEAFQSYARALTPDGLLLVHVSSRSLDVDRVAAGGAAALGWEYAVGHGQADPAVGGTESVWVAMSPDRARVDELAGLGSEREGKAAWSRAAAGDPVVWTDDHASLLPIIRW